MKVYLMSDLEGATEVVRFDNRKRAFSFFYSNRSIEGDIERLTSDIIAAIEGAVDAGATEIIVCDGHGNKSVLADRLPPVAKLAPRSSEWMPLLDKSIDALLMVGFHAKAGTKHALLSHTFSRRVKDVLLNNRSVGEIEICALYAGMLGIPATFISGDDYAVNEAIKIIPNIETATVKYSKSRRCAACLPATETATLIREGVCRALRRYDKIMPLVPKPPFKVSRIYHLPGISLLRNFKSSPYSSTSVGIYRQDYEDTDFLRLMNAFFGYKSLTRIYK